MVEINLLEWRASKLKYERRTVRLYLLYAVVLAVLIVFCIHYWLRGALFEQEKNLNVFGDQIVDAENMPAQKMQINFQETKNVLNILNAASLSGSGGICYTRIIRDGGRLTLIGKAKTLLAVTSALEVIDRAAKFPAIRLKEVKRATIDNTLHFSLESSGG